MVTGFHTMFRFTKKGKVVLEALLTREFINAIRSRVLFLEYSLNPGTSMFSPNGLKYKLDLCYRPSEYLNFWYFQHCNMRTIFQTCSVEKFSFETKNIP